METRNVTVSEARYLLGVCIMVGLFLLILIRQFQERQQVVHEYLQISIGETSQANYGVDPFGTSLPSIQVEAIADVIMEHESSKLKAQARFETVENNLLTPVPLISNRFASPTSTPTATLTPTATPTRTPTPTLTYTPTPDPCTHGRLDGEVWVVGLCDTFWYISWQTGYAFEDLLAQNPNISVYDLILPGQIIQLPKITPGPTATLVIPTAPPTLTLTPFPSHFFFLPVIFNKNPDH